MKNNAFYFTREAVKILEIFHSFDKKFEFKKKKTLKSFENMTIKKSNS